MWRGGLFGVSFLPAASPKALKAFRRTVRGCTTNLMDALDPASLRRFTFKVNCRYLSPKQARAAFAHFFDRKAPAGIDGLSNLTPGDFAAVKKKAAITGQFKDPKALLTLLQCECAIKPDMPSPIGFGAVIAG